MIRLEQVSKFYKTNALVAVGIRKISLDFKLGEFVVITGESGSGKSTLLNVLSGLDTFEEGEFFLFDKPTSHYTIEDWEAYRANYVGFVFQNYNILDSYTVFQNVMLALELQGYEPARRKERALEIIEKVGLSHRVHHRAVKLSGGEKQRTVIARALAKDCPTIICDEPTGNLDSKSAEEIIKLLHDISKDKLVILVSHNYAEVEAYATRRIKMSDGEVVEDIKLNERRIVTNDHLFYEQKDVRFLTTLRIAFRNLIATPRKLMFMLLLQVFFVILSFLIYGTIQGLFHDNVIIPSGSSASEHSLTIQKLDSTPFTIEEIEAFKAKKYVIAVNEYETIGRLFRGIGREDFFSERAAVLKSSDYVDGRAPLVENEVVLSQGLAFYLGVGVNEDVELRTASSLRYTFFVSGISSRTSNATYFHDDFFENKEFVFKSIIQDTGVRNIDVNYNYMSTNFSNITYDESFPENTAFANTRYNYNGIRDSVLYMETGYGDHASINLETTFVFSESRLDLIVDTDTYQGLVDYFTSDEMKHRIVLNVYDRFDGEKLLNSIDHSRYIVYYPALTQNTQGSPFGIALTVGSYIVIGVVAIFMFTILRFVFKNMLETRRKDFAIYRSVGASKKFLKTLILREIIIQILLGTLLTAIVIVVSSIYVGRIQNTMRFITAGDILFILFVFSYMTIRTSVKYNESIYQISVIDTLNKSLEV
jgi:putative ABC transport system permease protein